jgi:glycosyltransferase involved in cell wall biosynthesis
MRLLVITRHPPLPEWDGASSYLFDLVSYFARQGWRVEIAWSQAPRHWRGPWPRRLPRALARVCSLQLPGALALGDWRWMEWGAWRARILHGLRRLLGRAPRRPPALPRSGAARPNWEWSRLPYGPELKFFRQRMLAFKPDAVLANYCWLTPALAYAGRARTAVLTHDIASQRLAPTRTATPRHAMDPAHPAGEQALLAQAHALLAITREDAAVFRAWLPHLPTVLTPKAAATPPDCTRAPVAGRCIFVGGLNDHNREGLQWLLREVWPLVRARHPQATLHVVGQIAGAVTEAPPGVVLRGPVDSLTPEYAAAAVALIPLLRGTGMKIKLVEAASHALACVTTPVGLQGLGSLRAHLIVARPAAGFAAGINRLLAHPVAALTLGRALRARVVKQLSAERSYGPALAAMSRGVPANRSPSGAPVVSIVMPVYNAARHLPAALASLLAQTWQDFELIAVNDGSTDRSGAILTRQAALDPRLIVIHQPNRGIVIALNTGIARARGEFIARMDADDEAAPTRLAAQVARLRAEPGLVALGSAVIYMDAAGHPVKAHPRPLHHTAIERALLAGDGGAMIHPSVTLRAAAVRQVGGYREAAAHVEDLDLFLRLARVGALANLASPELYYRVHAQSVNFTRNAGRQEVKLAVLREARTTRGLDFDPARFPDGFARYADAAHHHREWAVTALAFGSRPVAVGHGWRTVSLRPFERASWRALSYALTAPLPPPPRFC